MRSSRKSANNSGQALLLVVLGLAVVLVVVLSVLSSTLTDVRIAGGEDESLRAFSAAEAGVEKQLIAADNGSLEGSFANTNASFTTALSSFGSGLNFNYPLSLSSGETATIWFVSHASDGSLICDGSHPCFTGSKVKVCWGKSGTSNNSVTTPALELSFYYSNPPFVAGSGDYSNIKVARVVVDPNSGRLATNSFDASDAGTCSLGVSNYTFAKSVDLAALGIPATSYGVAGGLQTMKVKLLYNSDTTQIIGADVNFPQNSGSTLPPQGSQIDSTGISGVSTRKVEVVRLYADLPPIFDAAVFSPVGLTK